MKQSTFPRSGVLILAPNSIRSLLPSTLISQVESLLESHRIDVAANLAEQQHKRIHGKASANGDEEDELHYVYQRLGFQCFSETMFEDAGKYFFRGDIDPRLLVGYYPELRGSLLNVTDSINIFAGVEEYMPHESSVDDIIVANLVRNYSPHLAPNTLTAPPTAELRKILGDTALAMLERFLRKRRARRRANESSATPKGKEKAINEVEDTVLAKIFARSEKTDDLYVLIKEPHHIVLSEIEPILRETGQYNALCIMYQQCGNETSLLDVWSKLVDGEWTDDDIHDPISNMVTLLNEKRDRALTQKWGIWLTKRDPERGLKLLMSRDSSKRRDKAEDDVALLQQIRDANAAAGEQFLEYLVLQKRSTAPELHTQLALVYVEQLLTFLAADPVSKLWRAKAQSYASSPIDVSFLSYFASTTPDSEHKRVRLKTILLLQGSSLYDPSIIRERLTDGQKFLKLELAIVEGKLGHHRAALAILVHDLRDAVSAEAYCTLGGDVVPAKTAVSIRESCELPQWASALFLPSGTSAKLNSKSPTIIKQKSVDPGLKKELLKTLLEVYMSEKDSSFDRAATLLNSQSMNLDAIDVIPLVPPDWPLKVLSSFLSRSFRRTLHVQHEGQIVKSISMGQNLEVADRTWPALRDYGAIVEEPIGAEENYDEKGILLEQASLELEVLNGIGHDDHKQELDGTLQSVIPSIT